MENDVKVDVTRLNRFEGEGTLRAFVDIAIADAVVITGLKVVNGSKGIFVSMPRQKGKNGEWFPTVYPLNKEVMQTISQTVLAAYGN